MTIIMKRKPHKLSCLLAMMVLGSVSCTTQSSASDAGLDAAAQDASSDGSNADALICHPEITACLGALDSFETPGELANWACATWAPATLDENGAPAKLSLGPFGATKGQSALQVPVRFLGEDYAQGYVGRDASLSFAHCAALSFDVTLPANAPLGLRAKLILLLGPDAVWSEPAASVSLVPGTTTKVTLALAGAIAPVPDRALLADVSGFGLKIEGNNVSFIGTVAIDNVRLEDTAPPSTDDSQAFSVGTFGGFIRPSGPQIPDWNGFLTFIADSTVEGHALRWPKLGVDNADFIIGTAHFSGSTPLANTLRFIDWVTLEASSNLASSTIATALLSRAFPAVRYHTGEHTFRWETGSGTRAPLAHMAFVDNGSVKVYDPGSVTTLTSMSEPWVLLWAGYATGWDFDVPTLITFEHRPSGLASTGTGVTFVFPGAAGAIQVMPLDGLRRRAPSETATWSAALPDDVVEHCRALVPILAAFPVGLAETFEVIEDEEQVIITDHYTYQEIADDWSTTPYRIAPIPPAIYHAGLNGYPVAYPAAQPTASNVATYFGPFAYVPGDRATYALPLPSGLNRLPIALRMDNAPAATPVRAELERILREEVPSEPSTDWLANDYGDAEFLCDALPTLQDGSEEQTKARSVGPRMMENTFLDSYIDDFTEPVTGQHFTAPTSYPEWNEPFDKEWNTGRQLTALARCAEAVDLDLARGLWPKILATYRYHRIFSDWATGSVLSSCLGLNELADGMNFAWEGMLGVGRLARKLGDVETFRDAAYRSARQQAALYQAWFQATWDKDIDYGIAFLSYAKIPASEVETRGAIDAYVEEVGSTTLEFQSFWQTTNYLYFDNAAQLSFYRDFGFEPRVRTLEYDIMPALHPSWTDGNVMDPVDQRYYGSNYTAAHLYTRAALFHDDPSPLFANWNGTRGTQVASQWYNMLWHGIAGPTLLAIERAQAPVVEAPVGMVRVTNAHYDATQDLVTLDLFPELSGPAVVRLRSPGGTWHEYSLELCQGHPVHFTAP